MTALFGDKFLVATDLLCTHLDMPRNFGMDGGPSEFGLFLAVAEWKGRFFLHLPVSGITS